MAGYTIPGIHHVTAIASDPQRNLDFYTGLLGLRLVKLTVNFDDPQRYHFYFGNGAGAPGSVLTFFPWPGARRGRVGNGQVSAVAFAVPPGATAYWEDRLAAHGVSMGEDVRFGERVTRFADPDGLPLELVETTLADRVHAWIGGPVPVDAAITGFHAATLAEADHEPTAAHLQQVLGWLQVGHEDGRYRFRAPAPGGGTLVDVVHAPDGSWGRLGAGTVHHIAWRTPGDAEQLTIHRRLASEGAGVSPVMDRHYFHSIYYREPGGVLFEIATDPPGFTVDEPQDRLGQRLMLPAQYEPQRHALERALPPLVLPQVRVEAR